MKIVIDARIMFTSTGRYVERLLEYLQRIDRDNQYVVMLMKQDFDRWEPAVANFSKVSTAASVYTVSEQVAFAMQLYRLNADLVHFTMPQHPILYRRRYVITVHDLTLLNFVNRRDETGLKGFYKYRVKPAVFGGVLRDGLATAAHILTDTEYVKQQLQDQFQVAPQRISYAYPAADPLADKPLPIPALKDQPFILYVGNAYPYKNLRRLLDAHAMLKQANPPVLVLAGKPDFFYDDLQSYARHKQLSNVRFAGFVTDAELAWLYQHADLYVFPSLSEGFGLPGVEAMLHGLPVVAARASCLPEVFGEGAAYFDPNDTADMTRVIDETLSNSQERARLKRAGLSHAKTFSWEHMAKQTLAVYNQALAQS